MIRDPPTYPRGTRIQLNMPTAETTEAQDEGERGRAEAFSLGNSRAARTHRQGSVWC